MKTMILALILMASTTAMAKEIRLTKAQKADACYFVLNEIPSDSPMTVETCVKIFSFYATEIEDQQILVEMEGLTVEYPAQTETYCRVWIPVSEGVQNPPNDPPSCELN